MSTQVERREATFERALGLFIGAFVGCAITAMYGSEWWVAPLAAFHLAAYCYFRWKTSAP